MSAEIDSWRALVLNEYQILDGHIGHKDFFYQFWGERLRTICTGFIAERVKPLGTQISEFGKIFKSELDYFISKGCSKDAVVYLKIDLSKALEGAIEKEKERQIKELSSKDLLIPEALLKIQNQATEAIRNIRKTINVMDSSPFPDLIPWSPVG